MPRKYVNFSVQGSNYSGSNIVVIMVAEALAPCQDISTYDTDYVE